MKQLDAKIAKLNILVSWVWSSSSAPIPYVSITIILTDYPSRETPFIGVPQHHNPLVHGLIVLPTPNPLLRLRSILLSKYDFPVRYNPATDTIPRGPGIEFINYEPYSVIMYSNLLYFFTPFFINCD